MSSQDLASEIQQGKDELTRLLRQPTLDDIIFTIAVRNLKDGRVWMNYQLLKDLFETLREKADEFPEKVQKLVRHYAYPDDIDHSMSRVMGHWGVIYYCEIRNDYWYIEDGVRKRGMHHYDVMVQEDKDALDKIASIYGRLLEGIGR